jgi:hypothetical protein
MRGGSWIRVRAGPLPSVSGRCPSTPAALFSAGATCARRTSRASTKHTGIAAASTRVPDRGRPGREQRFSLLGESVRGRLLVVMFTEPHDATGCRKTMFFRSTISATPAETRTPRARARESSPLRSTRMSPVRFQTLARSTKPCGPWYAAALALGNAQHTATEPTRPTIEMLRSELRAEPPRGM